MKRSEATKEYAVLSGDGRGANMTGVQKDSGVIALEAAMSLPIFLFLMLALYSMTLLFTAQSLIGHTLRYAWLMLAFGEKAVELTPFMMP